MPRPPKYIASPAEQLAAAPAGLFVGTSGWSYPTWKPRFYPPDVPARAFLHSYAARLTAVEVNYTFRSLPTRPQLGGWLAATPPGFRFSFKAPQRITHFARLRECAEAVAEFTAAVEPAREAGKLGPLLFQLPPNLQADPQRLASFLALPALSGPSKPRIAFEFRHPSWFSEPVLDALRAAEAALCVADTDDLATPDVVTAPFLCYRLRRDGGYTRPELQRFAEGFTERCQSAEVYAFFRHQDEPTGALNAVDLLRMAVEAADTGTPRGEAA